jgi:NADPH-dependent curcumin reductase
MVLCGLISGYNEIEPLGDFSPILMRRLNFRGFIILDFAPRWGRPQRASFAGFQKAS